jgi:hypothetical protein
LVAASSATRSRASVFARSIEAPDVVFGALATFFAGSRPDLQSPLGSSGSHAG